jgi:hypothetical protein
MQIIYRHIEQGSLSLCVLCASSLSSGWAGWLPDRDAASPSVPGQPGRIPGGALCRFQPRQASALYGNTCSLRAACTLILCDTCLHGVIACSLSCSRVRLRGPSRDPESSLCCAVQYSLTALAAAAAANSTCTGAGPLEQLEAVGRPLSPLKSLLLSPLRAPSSCCCRSCRASLLCSSPGSPRRQ